MGLKDRAIGIAEKVAGKVTKKLGLTGKTVAEGGAALTSTGVGAEIGIPIAAVGVLAAANEKKVADKARKKQEKRDKRKEEIDLLQYNIGQRAPILKNPLFWVLLTIITHLWYAIRSSFMFGINLIVRPTTWMLETVVLPMVQIPFKILGKTTGTILAVVVIFGMLVGGAYFVATTYPPVMGWFIERGIHDMKDFGVWVVSIPGAISEDIRETFRYRMALATGEYWEGEEEGEEVGIFLEKVTPLQSKFYLGDPIIILADLRGVGDFGDIDANLTASCLLVEDNIPADKIYPTSQIELWTLSNSKEGFECEFYAPPTITEYSKEVKVMIEFPFETKGRVTLTFMDEDFIRQLRREGKSPNVEYNIPEVPVSLFQPGPIMVGLGTVRSNPIGAKAGKIILTRLGFTLNNRWEGEIINITEVVIIVDSGISLPENENTVKMEGPIPLDGGRSKYTVNREFLGKLTDNGEDPIKTFTSLNFRMEFNSSVLKGKNIISHKEIEVEVKYDYRLSRNTQIQLDYKPFQDKKEETKGACGTDYCDIESQKCCERNEDQYRECKTECPNSWTDVTEEIAPPEEGAECGDTTCASDETCCLCARCRGNNYACLTQCDDTYSREVQGGTAST